MHFFLFGFALTYWSCHYHKTQNRSSGQRPQLLYSIEQFCCPEWGSAEKRVKSTRSKLINPAHPPLFPSQSRHGGVCGSGEEKQQQNTVICFGGGGSGPSPCCVLARRHMEWGRMRCSKQAHCGMIGTGQGGVRGEGIIRGAQEATC